MGIQSCILGRECNGKPGTGSPLISHPGPRYKVSLSKLGHNTIGVGTDKNMVTAVYPSKWLSSFVVVVVIVVVIVVVVVVLVPRRRRRVVVDNKKQCLVELHKSLSRFAFSSSPPSSQTRQQMSIDAQSGWKSALVISDTTTSSSSKTAPRNQWSGDRTGRSS